MPGSLKHQSSHTQDLNPAASTTDPGDGLGCPFRATKLKVAWLQRASPKSKGEPGEF
jgi:hypothetical protein